MKNANPTINVSVTFRHTESTEALKSYVAEKITHCLEKYVGYDADVAVVLTVEKRDHSAEIKVLSKGYDLVAKATTDDLYAAIDKAVDNIDTQVRKRKDRMQDHKHQSVSSVTP